MEKPLLFPEVIKALASLITSLAWPLVAVVALLVFRPQMRSLLLGITEFKGFGFEAKLQSAMAKAAEDADKSGKLSTAPSESEVKRASILEDLTTQSDVGAIRQQVDELGFEYEKARASLHPGDARTRRLEVVVSKMRTIGLAASRFRYELVTSPSPGKRLQAIASLQVLPDYDLLDWLVERVSYERPFVAYQALVALYVAAKGDLAKANKNYLISALAKLERVVEALGVGDRRSVYEDFRKVVVLLKDE